MEAKGLMELTQITIAVLNMAVFITLIIYTGRRKAPPLWLFAIIGFSIGMCITDSIIRQSIWPVFTAVVMTAVFVITLLMRLKWLEANEYKRLRKDPNR